MTQIAAEWANLDQEEKLAYADVEPAVQGSRRRVLKPAAGRAHDYAKVWPFCGDDCYPVAVANLKQTCSNIKPLAAAW
eukprot:788951-Pyramimonas_sp.AAC.1